MKNTNGILLLLITVAFNSCNEKEVSNKTNIFSISETFRASDDPTLIDFRDYYIYQNKKLIEHTEIQTYNDNQIINRQTIGYASRSVSISDERGYQYEYTIGDNGYIYSCFLKEADTERNFSFLYTSEGYLSNIIEAVGTISGTEYKSISFEYDKGDLITAKDDGENGTTQLFTPDTLQNKDQLPFYPILETYPIYFHKAMFFAGLLGKSVKHLPKASRIKNNDNESTTYQYKTNMEGRITSCHVKTISFETTYNRTFDYHYN